MPNIPEPEIMELDPNDENLILGIPEDVVADSSKEQEPIRRRVRKCEVNINETYILFYVLGQFLSELSWG